MLLAFAFRLKAAGFATQNLKKNLHWTIAYFILSSLYKEAGPLFNRTSTPDAITRKQHLRIS
jgi:hypothetical protein